MIIDLFRKLSEWLSPNQKQALDSGLNWNTNTGNIITTENDLRSEFVMTTISQSITQSQHYAISLKKKGGKIIIPIVIGGYEAQAIAVTMEGMTPNMPMTHDLLKTVIETTNHTLVEVWVSQLVDGVFKANLILKSGEVQQKVICRASDAIAIALRFDVPIFVFDKISTAVGVLQ